MASAVLLIPWIAYLGLSLPHRYVAHNWDATWVGFDVLLFVLSRRHPPSSGTYAVSW